METDINEKIRAITSRNIVCLSWGGKSTVISRFRDNDTGVEFEQAWRDVQTSLRKFPHTVFGVNALTEKEGKERLRAATSRNIEIVRWGGSTKQLSDFVDHDTGATFTKSLNYVLMNLKRKPDIRFGVSKSEIMKKDGSPFANPDVRQKARQTIADRYTPEELGNLTKAGMRKKHGVDNVSVLPEIKDKKRATAVSHGFIKLLNGKTLQEIAREKKLSYSCVQSNVKEFGPDIIDFLSVQTSALEALVMTWLNDTGIEYQFNRKQAVGVRPDFYIPSHNLVIECDGLYWHSDVNIQDQHYHSKRRQAFKDAGIRALFFRSDELLTRPEACKAVLMNALGKAPRVFARKCVITEGDSSFFDQHHIMGAGAGSCYFLVYDNKPVAGIQFKCVDKNSREYEISRFCTDGSSVVGGFSRLLTHAIQVHQPANVKTYIDLRYGTGAYLPSLGFHHKATHLSFKWTNGRETVHRMKFPGNSGYENGWFKIWDCGQARWDLILA